MQRMNDLNRLGFVAMLLVTLSSLLGYTVLAQPQGGGFGPGGPNRETTLLVEQFDADEDGWLNGAERADARTEAKSLAAARPARRGPGGRGRGPGGRGRDANQQPVKPGKQIAPADVEIYPDTDLYDTSVLRTLFFEFDSDDWETELSDFYGTDVEVPAKLTVDGKTYPNVGARFRGASSYFRVPAGKKRSLNVSIDMADSNARLGGYRTLNLLNSNGDSSMMSTVLYSEIAGKHIPVPKANHVRVVINGELWGVYVNVQQFNKDFLKEHFDTKQGTRWKVPGSPRGDGGLRYLGEEIEPYRQRFSIKPSDNKNAWQDLIELCRTLNEIPTDELVSALEPMLDIDSTLWFLALDVSLVNSDGYWVRASDYSLYQDTEGRFHLIPHDMNEAFLAGSNHGRPGGRGGPRRGPMRGSRRGPPGGPPPRIGPQGVPGPGFGPPPGGPPGASAGGLRGGQTGSRPSVTLDPLVGIKDDKTPLHSKLLAVPELKARYLKYVRQIARQSLDWREMAPRVAAHRALISEDVQEETRKLTTHEEFLKATDSGRRVNDQSGASSAMPQSLRDWFEQRQIYLLEQTAEGD